MTSRDGSAATGGDSVGDVDSATIAEVATTPDTAPATGFAVPWRAGAAPLPAVAPLDDPLVAPAGSGFGGWARRFTATLRRSGGPLFVLLLVAAVVAAVLQFLVQTVLTVVWRPDEPAGFLLVVDISSIAGLLVSSAAWGAGISMVTQRAAGGPGVNLGTALTTGLRRWPVMSGWALVLFAPVTVAGTLSYQLSGSLLVALLPAGLYWGLAGSLVSVVVVYERGATAMLRSVALVHRAFGAALARVLPGLLLYLVGLVGGAWLTGWLFARADPLGGGATELAGVWLATASLGVVVDTLVSVLLLVGLLLTYTQLRAREEPLSTAALYAAAHRGG